MKTITVGSVILLVLGLFSITGATAKTNNIQIFTNGSIYIDVDHKVNNLLVKNGTIAAYNVDIIKYPKAIVTDLKGAVAYPGFIDSHAHLLETGYFFYAGVNLLGITDPDSIAKILAEKVKTTPKGGVILGGGFSLRDYDKWSLADLAKIDAVTGDNPLFLGDKLGHNAIINSASMKIAGLTPTTKIPLGGKMGVENGKLTGMLRESGMNLPFSKISSLFNSKEMKTGTLQMLQHWASIGYTGIVDLMGGPGTRIMRPDIFKKLEKKGELPLRINYTYTIFNLKDVDNAAKYIGKDTDLVRFVGCKIFVDGAFAGGQAWTSWTNKQGAHGLQEIYTDDIGGQNLNLNRIVAKVEKYGMNMHYHTQGDLAISAVLDALDKVVAKNGKLKGTHTLIHLAFPTDEQIERIKKFNGHVVTTTQPGFWAVEDDTSYYYGKMTDQAYPIKKLVDSGISVGMSTDFSVSPPAYAPAMVVTGVATTGANNHKPLSIKDMVQGFTVASAVTTGKKDIGKLEVGYKADMVVFDQDLYSVQPKNFNKDNPKLLATYVGGKKVYEAK